MEWNGKLKGETMMSVIRAPRKEEGSERLGLHPPTVTGNPFI